MLKEAIWGVLESFGECGSLGAMSTKVEPWLQSIKLLASREPLPFPCAHTTMMFLLTILPNQWAKESWAEVCEARGSNKPFFP